MMQAMFFHEANKGRGKGGGVLQEQCQLSQLQSALLRAFQSFGDFFQNYLCLNLLYILLVN
jgi:hypothetical protein